MRSCRSTVCTVYRDRSHRRAAARAAAAELLGHVLWTNTDRQQKVLQHHHTITTQQRRAHNKNINEHTCMYVQYTRERTQNMYTRTFKTKANNQRSDLVFVLKFWRPAARQEAAPYETRHVAPHVHFLLLCRHFERPERKAVRWSA